MRERAAEGRVLFSAGPSVFEIFLFYHRNVKKVLCSSGLLIFSERGIGRPSHSGENSIKLFVDTKQPKKNRELAKKQEDYMLQLSVI